MRIRHPRSMPRGLNEAEGERCNSVMAGVLGRIFTVTI